MEETMQNNAAPDTVTQPAQKPTTDGENSGSSNGATFTQEEHNRYTGAARKEGRESGIKDVLKKLGVASEADALALIAEAQTLKKSQMSEVEKAQAERDVIIKERDALMQRLDQQTTMFRQKEIRGAVEKAAGALKANDAETVYLYLKEKYGTDLGAIMSDEGEIDTKALDKLMEKVKADKPVYFTPPVQAFGSQSNANGRVIPQQAKPDISKFRL